MTVELPDHLADPAAVLDDPDHVALYLPDPSGGWRLHPGLLEQHRTFLRNVAALEADTQAKLAELRERDRRHIEQFEDVVTRTAAREALTKAGASPDLIDGAVALFRQEVPLRVTESREVVVAEAGAVAGVNFAASAWLAGASGKAYRDRPPEDAAGDFTRQLRTIWQ